MSYTQMKGKETLALHTAVTEHQLNDFTLEELTNNVQDSTFHVSGRSKWDSYQKTKHQKDTKKLK